MRIAAVTVDVLQVPLDPPYFAAGKTVSDYVTAHPPFERRFEG